MAITQDGRMMNIQTPLGRDVLLINSFAAEEEMSRLYSVVAELVHEGSPGGGAPHEVAPNTILGKNVCIQVIQRDGTERFFNGIVNRFEQRNRDGRFTHYEAEIVPNFWLLSQRKQSRIFQQKTVPEIVETVFKGLNYSFKLQGTFEKRNYCVQYRETDLDFAMRLMEEEGIFFFFEHTSQEHKMIIGNNSGAHQECPTNCNFTFDFEQPDEEDFISTVRAWIVNHRMQSGKVTFWDHNFELPYKNLEASRPTRFSLENKDKLEVYDYPGGYSRKFDGVDKSGGDQAAELEKVFREKDKAAAQAMEEIDCRYKIISGAGDCSSMTAGHRFNLINHPGSQDGTYVLTSVSHTATQSPDYNSEDTVLDPYDNSFTCIPIANIFRPGQITPKPTVEGVQTATVVGPSGEEIFTDKYGRIKVQFHWDRHGKNDADSSCWMRVAQNWAGKKWGTMFIPRIGMEVVVDFLEGDPDQPIIIGSVYNADTMPPYTLPDDKTKSTIKSNSSKGGGGFNEFRIEDKKDGEQIFIHAQKDLDIRVKNDKKEIVKRDQHVIVEGNSFQEGKGDSHTKLSGDSNTEIGGSASLKVGGDIDTQVGGKMAVDAGGEIHLNAGMKVVIEAGTQITLKVGGNFVDIGPAGVTIVGTLVNINSGGGPGSGGGCSTTAPTAPKEAVDDKAGDQATKPSSSSPPPEQPINPGAGAGAMSGAAGSGAPTVESGTGGAGGGGNTGGSTGGQSSGTGAAAGKDGEWPEESVAGGGSGSGGSANAQLPESAPPPSGTGAAAGKDGEWPEESVAGGGSGSGGSANAQLPESAPPPSGTGAAAGKDGEWPEESVAGGGSGSGGSANAQLPESAPPPSETGAGGGAGGQNAGGATSEPDGKPTTTNPDGTPLNIN